MEPAEQPFHEGIAATDEMAQEVMEVIDPVVNDIVDDLMEDVPPVVQSNQRERLLQLFLSNLYISACTFGGGFVIITFMKRKFLDKLHWIEEEEMLDLTALAQSAPGAIAVNAAILVGWKVGGLSGMLISVLATIIPPMAILIAISFCYAAFTSNPYVAMTLKGMQAGVAAVIFDVAFDLGHNVLEEKNLFSVALMVIAFCATFFFNVNVVYIILAAAALGVGKAVYALKKGVTLS